MKGDWARNLLASVAGACGLVLTACVGLRLFDPAYKEPAANIGSAAWALFAVGILALVPSVRSHAAAWPRAARWLVPIATVLLCVGQVGGHSETTFPLAHWHMFSSASAAHRYTFNEIEGTTRGGANVRLIPGVLFPSVARHLLYAKVQRTLTWLTPPPRTRALSPARRQRMDDTLAAFARRYDQLHADDPLVLLRVRRIFVSFDAVAGTHELKPLVLLEREVGTR